ncbi:hypothetical protein OR1_02008 [Geobacter sp. OR-1]|uniref:hypothetical protein n=1 Tax=Geobacter sp. OR-1 TaxID=1266765 RepID=UPI000542D7FC|nr:hypothetical protein [Geobacter sp. OR-1]GAM09728.1 hypothetical protein OR1_02008 [Geobacter sp. OR-1]
MRNVPRTYAAALLIIAYVTLLLGQLAPMAMGSAIITHAITGECSGDCDIDGCSPASRANHTCCCGQKKQQRVAMIQPAMKTAVTQAGKACCCPTKVRQSSVPVFSCCKNTSADHAEAAATATQDSLPVYKCGCPCSDGKQLALEGAGKIDWVPFPLSVVKAVNYEVHNRSLDPARLTSRHSDPPDPPPKIAAYV